MELQKEGRHMSLDRTSALSASAQASAVLPTDVHPRAIFAESTAESTLMNEALIAAFITTE
jgi:hypothetical protein